MKVRSYLKTTLFTFFISTQGFSCEYIDDQYERRRQKFNGQRDEKEYAQHTQNTNKLLSDYDKVSCVPATLNQKKSIIKTTMTKFFVHKNTEQYRLSFRVLKETDKNYRHFKVLEQTEALSDKLAGKLVDKDGVKTIDRDFLSAHWDDHKELDAFGKITQELFLIWFNEALSEHNESLVFAQSTKSIVEFSLPHTTSPRQHVPNLSTIMTHTHNVNTHSVSPPTEFFSPIGEEKKGLVGQDLVISYL